MDLARKPDMNVPDPDPKGDVLTALGATVVNGKASKSSRLAAAAQLWKGLPVFMGIRGDTYPPRLPTPRGLILQLRAGYHEETDAERRGAITADLAAPHLAAVGVYEVDEGARAQAVTLFRAQPGTEAANYATREQVIYPTTPAHRETIRKTGNLGP